MPNLPAFPPARTAEMMMAEDIARQTWKGPIPPWVMALARACDTRGMPAIAYQLGVETGALSQALSHGGADIEARVSAQLLKTAVDCPVLGFLKRQTCLIAQKSPADSAYSAPLRRALAESCPNCPHHKGVTHAVR